jgi:hypothetical protein
MFTVYFKYTRRITQNHTHLLLKSLTHSIGRKERTLLRNGNQRSFTTTQGDIDRATEMRDGRPLSLSSLAVVVGGIKGRDEANQTTPGSTQHNELMLPSLQLCGLT